MLSIAETFLVLSSDNKKSIAINGYANIFLGQISFSAHVSPNGERQNFLKQSFFKNCPVQTKDVSYEICTSVSGAVSCTSAAGAFCAV